MIIPVTMYRLVCSFPACPSVADDEEYYAWADPSQAIERARDCDWHAGAGQPESGHFYCNNHPTVWASDFEGEGAGWDLGVIAHFTEPRWPIIVIDDISYANEATAYLCLDQDMLTEGLDKLARNEPIQDPASKPVDPHWPGKAYCRTPDEDHDLHDTGFGYCPGRCTCGSSHPDIPKGPHTPGAHK